MNEFMKTFNIDQWVNYERCGQNKVIQGGNNHSWILKGHVARLVREKKQNMHFLEFIYKF